MFYFRFWKLNFVEKQHKINRGGQADGRTVKKRRSNGRGRGRERQRRHRQHRKQLWRRRTERAKRDRWMALVPRFMVDQEFPVRCTRFFRLRSTSSCPALLLLLFCLFLDFLFVSSAPAPDVVARFCLIYLATCRLATATRCNCGEARVRRRKMSLGCIHNMPEP